MLSLDEAIQHCHEKAEELRADTELFKRVKATSEKIKDCEECANEHEQLAGWLKELKEFKEAQKGDLISREALKNDLITFFPDKCLEGITAKTLFKQILTDINNAPTVDIQTAVMELYKRYQPRLATNVYKFGVELEELLGRYAERR